MTEVTMNNSDLKSIWGLLCICTAASMASLAFFTNSVAYDPDFSLPFHRSRILTRLIQNESEWRRRNQEPTRQPAARVVGRGHLRYGLYSSGVTWPLFAHQFRSGRDVHPDWVLRLGCDETGEHDGSVT
jgi:hypothetical protein